MHDVPDTTHCYPMYEEPGKRALLSREKTANTGQLQDVQMFAISDRNFKATI